MRVNTKVLVEFLQRASINGIIEDMLLDFKAEGLKVTAREPGNVLAVNAFLHRDGVFVEYQEGEVPIQSSNRLINLLKTVDGIADISFEKNMFRVTGDSIDFDIIMGRKEYLTCKPLEKWPNLNYSGKFLVDASIFDLANRAYGELKANNSVREVVLSLESGMFKVQVGNGLSDTVTPKAVVDADWKATGSFSTCLLDATKGMKGDLKISFDNDLPLMIEQKTDAYNISMLFAALSEDDE